MEPLSIILVLVGLALGAFAGWAFAGSRTRAGYEGKLAEAQTRAAAAEGSLGELRQQLGKREDELAGLRSNLEESQKARTAAETALEAEREKIVEEKELLEEARDKLSDAFKALASEVLRGESQSFIAIAHQAFEKLRAEAAGDLGKRQEAIQGVVDPLSQALVKLEAEIRELEGKRQEAYGRLMEQVQSLAGTSEQLERQAGNLTSTLKGTPQVKGIWGELALERVLEFAGLQEGIHFDRQVTVGDEEGRYRADAVVHLPGERDVIIDAKVSLMAFLQAMESQKDEEREVYLIKHAALVREHMNGLASKRYWEKYPRALDLVVLFLPSEAVFRAGVQYDPLLLQSAIEKQVIVASPTTLVVFLRAVAYGWKQELVARSALQIRELGKELYSRARTLAEHFNNIRSGLEKAVKAYNESVGSMELRLFSQLRKFEDLGVPVAEEIPRVEPVDQTPRTLTLPEKSGPD